MDVEDSLEDVEYAASFFKVSPRTVEQWAREGLLPRVKLGSRRAIRFYKSDLEAFARSRRESHR